MTPKKPQKPPKKCYSCRTLCTQSTLCPGCQQCRRCGCCCYMCEACNKKHGYNRVCKYCEECKALCTCRKFPHTLKLPKTTLTSLDTITNKLERHLGLEVELATWGTIYKRAGLIKLKNFEYLVDHDGSVVPSGCEMVIQPLRGDSFVKAIFELAKLTATRGATVNETCGLHVHVGCSDVSYWGLRRLLVLYKHFEPEIYGLLVQPGRANSQSRHGYKFCSMFSKRYHDCIAGMCNSKTTGELKRWIQELVYGFSVPANDETARREYENARHAKYGGERGTHGFISRYMGLNMHSWFHRGTIEWRMKEGTLDLQELLCWPLFCGWFVHIAAETCDSYVVPQEGAGVPYFLKMSLLEFIQTTMPKHVYEWARERAK